MIAVFGPSALKRCLKKYSSPALLLIDEVGYMSYSNDYADLLYEVISSRYQISSTVITTNREFKQWGEIFPNAACVATMVDRLTHKAEAVLIEGGVVSPEGSLVTSRGKGERTALSKGKKQAGGGKQMLTVMFMIQCDVCGKMYEQVRTSCRPEPQEWSLIAGLLQATCTTEDYWFFNSKTRKHWCLDCKTEYEDCTPPPPLSLHKSEDQDEADDCSF